MIKDPESKYLRFRRRVLIVAVGGSAERSARAVLTGANTASLGQVLLALCLADLNLLLLAATPQLFGLEGALGLELGTAMLGDVSVSHACGSLVRLSGIGRFGGAAGGRMTTRCKSQGRSQRWPLDQAAWRTSRIYDGNGCSRGQKSWQQKDRVSP